VRLRRTLLALLAVGVIMLGGLFVVAALRDTEPPLLYIEHVARLAEGEPIQLFVSANEPATFVVEYAGATVEEVAQEHVFALPAVAGVHAATIVATDAAGNFTEEAVVITGVPALRPLVQAPEHLTAGDPLGVRVQVGAGSSDPALNAAVVDVLVTLDGVTVPTRVVGGAGAGSVIQGLAATTMAVDPTTQLLEVTLLDEFGRSFVAEREVVLTPLPVAVEQLQLSAATLSLVTPEARELEATVVAAAWAQAEAEQLWELPFTLPISGVNTSGFGDARRYAQGGPVSFHYGLDMAAPFGTPVHATNAGRVVIAGQYPIKGGFVAIDHGAGVMSYYFHQSHIGVVEGQYVEQGEVIGEVGSEGLSTGPHLHWEMRVHGEPTNPSTWVGLTFPGEAE